MPRPRFVLHTILGVVAVAGIGALAIRGDRAIARDLTAAALSQRQSVADLAAATVTERLDRLTDLGVAFATRVRFRELVAAGRWNEAIAILQHVPRDFPTIERLFLADPGGTLRADVPALPAVRGVNFAERDWYRGIRDGWAPYVSSVYRRAAEPRVTVVAAAIPIGAADGRPIGILVMQVRVEALSDWTAGIDLGDHGVLYVVDRAGTVASHSEGVTDDSARDFSAVPAVQRVLRGESGVAQLFDPEAGADRIAALAPVARYGWGVVAQQPPEVAFAARDAQLWRVRLANGVIVLLFVALAYVLARSVIERREARAVRAMRDELEQRVTQRTAQLQAANRELEGFSYSVSHDLRAPLRAIDGFARMVDEDTGPALDAEGRRRLGVIRDNAVKMSQLIDDLLAFSRTGRHALATAPIDMTALARQVAAELADGRAGVVSVGDLPPASGDSALLRQVWDNLLSNALKFTARTSEPAIEIGGRVEGHEAVYFVRDNGAGFEMQYVDKLFGVFQRLHRADEFPGTGVGLAIVQRVVARHGGRVWAEGEAGQGATFWFTLPVGAGPH